MLLYLLGLVAGLVVLGIGGETLVQGASRLARSLGLSALMVGLTIVAFGTSAPELAVSVMAGWNDEDMLAIGNVVGSNIANLLLVLGLAALARPLSISLNVVRIDAPVMLATTVAFAAAAFIFSAIPVSVGIVFFGGLIAYVLYTYKISGQGEEPDAEEEPIPKGTKAMAWNIIMILFGLVGLKYGADLIIYGATGVAEQFGMSQRLIGMTIVAIGTSLPEIATCVVASRRNQPDIAIGNIIGSNIFNVLSVIGISSAVVGGLSIEPTAIKWDFPVMLGATVVALPILWTGKRVTRTEGGAILFLYLVYLVVTVLVDQT